VTISHESAERISLLLGVAREQGSLVTLQELLPLLREQATEEELVEAISTAPALSRSFELKSGYVTERSGRSAAEQAVAAELENRRKARENLRWAKEFMPKLRSASFGMVAASGSTSYLSASKSTDLDLFCIARSGRLWTALTRGLILARAFRVLHRDCPEVCFSCLMDEDFASAMFRREQGPLFARDALETIVLEGDPAYRWLLKEAVWISSLYPNAYSAKVGTGPARRIGGGRPSAASRALEKLVFLTVGTFLRTKSKMLNGRLTAKHQLDRVFTARFGPDHLIYESRRYSELKQRYSSSVSLASRRSERKGLDGQRGDGVILGQDQLSNHPRDEAPTGEQRMARSRNAGAYFIRLSTRGRVTGLPHIVQLRFSWKDGSFHVVSGSSQSDWVLNAVRHQSGVVRLGEMLYEVSAEPVDEAERETILTEFRTKYGRGLVDRWYSTAGAALRLTPVAPPTRRGSTSGELETKSSLDDWIKEQRDYYSDVASAFDSASEEYDFTIGHNFINTWIRKRSIEVLLRSIRSEDFLVEVGAGTGAEAIQIAKHVRGIIATDVSKSMVDLMAAKVRAKHLEGKVVPVRLAAFELSKLRGLLGGKELRVAYSFNGALNCEPRLEKFVSSLADLLGPGGLFICSVRNTLCLAEALWHAAVLQFDRMNPRMRQPIMVSVGGTDIPSTYYSPGEFLRKFESHFKAKEVIALPGLLPPAYLNNYFLKLGSLGSAIGRIDRALSGLFPLNRYGDQTLFVFKKLP